MSFTSFLFPGCGGVHNTNGDDIWSSFNETTFPDPKGRIEINEGYICPECNTDKYVQIHEDEVGCMECGTHICYLIDSSAEYRWFGSDDRSPDPCRVGNPLNPLLPESSMGTRILYRAGDSNVMRRIRQYHLWNIMPYRERTLWGVFENLQVRASNSGISMAIVEETKQLYAQVSPLCICRGQQKDALLAACLFESLKRHDTPRRPIEIAEIFQIDSKLITRGVKQFSGLLDAHLHAAAKHNTEKQVVSMDKTDTPSTSFKHYLEPALYKLETPRSMHGQIIELATFVGDTIDELGICPETTPSSLAASALALTCEKLNLTKSNAEIAKVCTISAATLQKCLKRIESWRPIIFKS
jgi:transcription initiation factor TFIIIB Brf1 subunit/transcription initiation factor TFIIB